MSNVCPGCGTQYPDTQKFCANDGKRLVEQSPDVASTEIIEALPTLETATRPRPMPTPVSAFAPKETDEAIAKYRQELSDACDDGVLEDWELEDLERQRKELGISMATHQRLLTEFNVVDRRIITLYIDQATGDDMLAGRPGDIPLRVENVDQRMLRRVTLDWHVDPSERAPRQESVSRVGPRRSKEFFLPVHPKHAGRYRLSGVLTIETYDEQVLSMSFGPTVLRVSKENTQQGPSHIHLEMKAEVLDAEGLQFGGGQPQQARGAVGAERKWMELPLRPCSDESRKDWLDRAGGKPAARQAPEPAQRFDKPTGTIQASRVVTICWSNPSRPDDSGFETVIIQPSTVRFGRDPNRSLVRLLVEPATAEHRHNIEQSMLISSMHFQLDRSPAGVTLTDLGSANGTTFSSGQRLPAHVPQPLQPGTSFNIGGALTVQTAVERNPSGGLSWVRLSRINNLQNRAYYMLTDAIGLWPDRNGSGVLGPVVSTSTGGTAQLHLQWIKGALCVCDQGGQVTIDGTALKAGTSHALSQGNRVQVGNLTGWVSDLTV